MPNATQNVNVTMTLCVVYPSMCEVKDSEGTMCFLKFVGFAQNMTDASGPPSCDTLKNDVGVTTECMEIMAASAWDFKDAGGVSLFENDTVSAFKPVFDACAKGVEPDEEHTPTLVPMSVTFEGMTLTQFNKDVFVEVTAKIFDVPPSEITDVEAVEIMSRLRHLHQDTYQAVQVSCKVAVFGTEEANDFQKLLTNAVESGTYASNLKEKGLVGFTSISKPEFAVEIVTTTTAAVATPMPTTTTKPPATTSTTSTTTTKAPATATTTSTTTEKTVVKTVTTSAPTSGCVRGASIAVGALVGVLAAAA